jgi:hypothetical protein
MYTAGGGLVCNSKETRIFEKYKNDDDYEVELFAQQPTKSACVPGQKLHHRTWQCWSELAKKNKSSACYDLARSEQPAQNRLNIMKAANFSCPLHIDSKGNRIPATPASRPVPPPTTPASRPVPPPTTPASWQSAPPPVATGKKGVSQYQNYEGYYD